MEATHCHQAITYPQCILVEELNFSFYMYRLLDFLIEELMQSEYTNQSVSKS